MYGSYLNYNSIEPAMCAGKGKVIVKSVAGAQPSDVYQYRLRVDSGSNQNIVRTFQTNDTFLDVSLGRYTVEIQKVCNGFFSTSLLIPNQVVSGTSAPLAINSIILIDSAMCNNGAFSIQATGGNASMPYKYALIPSIDAIEGTFTYVRQPQTDSIFENLAPGKYFVRVYDTCGTMTSGSITLFEKRDTVLFRTILDYVTFYACDSINIRYSLLGHPFFPNVMYTPADPRERFLVTYGIQTVTINNMLYYVPFGNGPAQASSSHMVTYENVTYPLIITRGYKSICGKIITRVDTIVHPRIGRVYFEVANSSSCDVSV